MVEEGFMTQPSEVTHALKSKKTAKPKTKAAKKPPRSVDDQKEARMLQRQLTKSKIQNQDLQKRRLPAQIKICLLRCNNSSALQGVWKRQSKS